MMLCLGKLRIVHRDRISHKSGSVLREKSQLANLLMI